MEKAKLRATEINLQYGKLGKYVILEVIDNLKWLQDSLNYNRAMDQWKDIQLEYTKLREKHENRKELE